MTRMVVCVAALLAACGGDDSDPDKDVTTDDPPSETGDTGETTPVGPDDADGDGFPASEDCDDANPLIYPGAFERCDGVDNACDGPDEPTQQVTLDDQLFGTISEAVAAAAAGDTVGVCAGTYVDNIVVTVDLVLFGVDRPLIDAGGAGAAIDVDEASVWVEGFEITGGSGSVYGPLTTNGGAVNGNDAADLTVVNCDIHGNLAEIGGGVLFGAAGGSLIDSVVRDNVAGSFGGGVYAEGPVDFVRSVISGNVAGENGGGVGVGAQQTLTFEETGVSDNQAVLGGGLFTFEGATLEADALTDFTGNLATGAGGGVYLWSADWSGATIEGNDVITGDPLIPGLGGGVYVFDGGSLSDVVVQTNTADSGGGALLRGDVVLNAAVLTGNVATDDAGGAYLLEATVTADADTEITDNEAADRGGGVVVLDGAWTGGTIEGNDAFFGGGMAFSGSTGVNSASATDVVVRANTCDESGGGLYATADFDLDGVTLTQNVSGDRGGGLYTTLDVVGTVLATGFDANVAAERGGGLYVNSGASVTLTDSPVERNQAQRGAGIYINDDPLEPVPTSQVTMFDCTVGANGDSSTISGGGARVQVGTLTVTNGDWSEGVTENSPDDVYTGDGGAVTGYGAGVSFTCDALACSPAP